MIKPHFALIFPLYLRKKEVRSSVNQSSRISSSSSMERKRTSSERICTTHATIEVGVDQRRE